MKKGFGRPSPAMVVALTSLFVALSGVSYSAVKANSVGAKQIKTGAVGTKEIRDGAVGSVDVADGALTGADLQDGSVGAADVSGIGSAQITDESLTSADVMNETLGTDDVQDGSLTGADVQDGSLTGADLQDGSLTGADVQDGSLTGANLDSSLTGANVQDGSLTGADVQDDSLDSSDVGGLGAGDVSGLTNDDLASGESVSAFARVGANGVLDNGLPAQNAHVDQIDVQHDAVGDATHTGPGIYCFGGLPFDPRSAMVTMDSAGFATSTNYVASVSVQRGNVLNGCDDTHQQARVSVLRLSDTATPPLTDHGFYIWFIR